MAMAALLLLLPLFFLGAVLVLHAARRVNKKAGLQPYPLLGHLPQFVANRHRILDWMTEVLESQPGCTLVLRRPGVQGVVTANPANVEHILRASFDNFPKGPRFGSILHDFLGRGIFNADGEAWRTQRKAASYGSGFSSGAENKQQRSEAAGEPLAGGEHGRRPAYDFLDAELRRRTGRTNRGQDVNEVSLFAASSGTTTSSASSYVFRAGSARICRRSRKLTPRYKVVPDLGLVHGGQQPGAPTAA